MPVSSHNMHSKNYLEGGKYPGTGAGNTRKLRTAVALGVACRQVRRLLSDLASLRSRFFLEKKRTLSLPGSLHYQAA